MPAAVLLAALAALVVSGAACGGGSGSPSPVPQAGERAGDPALDPAAPQTALPPDLPEGLEVEVRRRTADGEDRVLKLTPAGARYGLSHGKARIALRYRLPEDALSPVYATLRHAGFDGLRTVPHEGGAMPGGTSLRVSTGTETYTTASMGRQRPAPDDAEAFTRCVAAAELLLPAGRSDVVVRVRWDPSMRAARDLTAGLDVDVGEDLVGLHRVPGPATPPAAGAAAEPETFELHLARARPLQLQLRQSSSQAPRASDSRMLTVQAGEEPGVEVVVEVAFDAALGEVVLRTRSPDP